MTDEIDIANERAEELRQAALNAPRPAMVPGQPGECDECGEHRARLVGGLCAPCREELGYA